MHKRYRKIDGHWVDLCPLDWGDETYDGEPVGLSISPSGQLVEVWTACDLSDTTKTLLGRYQGGEFYRLSTGEHCQSLF